MLSFAQMQVSRSAPNLLALLFYAAGALAVASAWAIVASTNIVRIAAYLLGALAAVAALYFLLAAELLAAIQLIVYAGGTLILIIFGIMLTQRNPYAQLKSARWERAAGLAIAAAFAALLVAAATLTTLPRTAAPSDLPTHLSVSAFGQALLSRFLAPFEVAGVLLLVVMIGAAYMARRHSHAPGEDQTPR